MAAERRENGLSDAHVRNEKEVAAGIREPGLSEGAGEPVPVGLSCRSRRPGGKNLRTLRLPLLYNASSQDAIKKRRARCVVAAAATGGDSGGRKRANRLDRMDFQCFLEFQLAMTNKKHPASVAYFFKVSRAPTRLLLLLQGVGPCCHTPRSEG
eukprot:1194251-Prorocentrum_minimum.AAC.3